MKKSELQERLFEIILIVGIGLLFRAASDLHDGLSARAPGVGWLAWHLVNWVSRDLWQTLLVAFLTIFFTRRFFTWRGMAFHVLLNWVLSAICSYYFHRWLYHWAETHRYFFDW